ncbi:MAG: hypothetical protein ACT4NL_15235 [Pseudomarimonas sp.]
MLPIKHRLAAVIATAVVALAMTGSAASADSDIAKVRILANGVEEAVEVEMNSMAVGESRQLVAASGKPAIVTRTAEGLTIEVGGKRTEVQMPSGHGEHGAHGHGEHLRVIKLAHGDAAAAGDAGHKVIVLKARTDGVAGEGDVDVITEDLVGADGEIDDAKLQELVGELRIQHGAHAADHDGDADGERVIVTRRVVKEADTQD